jgi:hypothetical protein
MTPQEKADSVTEKHKDKVRHCLNEAARLMKIPRSADYKVVRLIEIIDGLCSLAAPVATCKKGCDHCCYQAVAVSTWEVERIAKYAKRKPTGFIGYRPERDETISHITEKFANTPCPFLVDDACAVYPVRPIVCRSHLSLSDDPMDCSLSLKPGGKVPYFNLEEFKTASVWMFIEGGYAFGDIREFFE